MRSGIFLSLFILLIIGAPASAQINNPQDLYNLILKSYVKMGNVKYKELMGDPRLAEYITYLENVNPETLSAESENLAFWINVYNAFVLKAVCDNYPIKSINDLNTGIGILRPLFGATVQDKKFIPLEKKKLSLNEIIKEKIWAKTKDPRIYFVLAFAAKGCPPLRDEPYNGDKINIQLSEQARLFLNDTTKNYFDLKNRVAYLSKIFEWHEKDFGKNHDAILLFISRFLPRNISSDLVSFTKKWDIVFKDFNWSLNETN